MLALRAIFWEKNDSVVSKPSLQEHSRGQRTEVKAQSWVSQQRSTVGHTDGEMGWRGDGWIKLVAQRQPCKEDVIRGLLESMKQAAEKKAESNGTRPTKKPRDLPLLELDTPEAGKRPTLEIKGDCKTIVGWINGHAKLKTRQLTVGHDSCPVTCVLQHATG